VEQEIQEPDESATPQPPQEKQELKREVLDFVKLVVWFLIIFLGLRHYVIEGYEVQGESMEPTLSNNERILVFKLPHQLSKFSLFGSIDAISPGDIVVFESPDTTDKRYVKRIIAMGEKGPSRGTVDAESPASDVGAKVVVNFERGDVFVNNRKIEEDYLKPDARTSSDVHLLKLDSGEYYVLGDNRDVSKDSRSFDAIPDSAIIGRAVLRFWPPNRISLLR